MGPFDTQHRAAYLDTSSDDDDDQGAKETEPRTYVPTRLKESNKHRSSRRFQTANNEENPGNYHELPAATGVQRISGRGGNSLNTSGRDESLESLNSRPKSETSDHGGGFDGRQNLSSQDYLFHKIADLQKEVEALQLENARLVGSLSEPSRPKTKWPVLHRVRCMASERVAIYLDQPTLLNDQTTNHRHWDGRRRIASEKTWERTQSDVPFVVYLEYECTARNHQYDLGFDYNAEIADNSHAPVGESVRILSSRLQGFLDDLFQLNDGLRIYKRENIMQHGKLAGPYYWFYHFRMDAATFSKEISSNHAAASSLLLEYLEHATADASSKADAAFKQGIVSAELMPFLFKPGSFVCLKEGGKTVVRRQDTVLQQDQFYEEEDIERQFHCKTSKITYDGEFRRSSGKETAHIELPASEIEMVPIESLGVRPVHHIRKKERRALVNRGRTFYECRKRRYVTYAGKTENGMDDMVDTRFMVDVQAYHMLHPKENAQIEKGQAISELDVESRDEDEDFLMQLPHFIEGYNMTDKKWVHLAVEHIRPVAWDKGAFENLAVDEDSKELIEALVRNKIELDQGIDFVRGKGTGLIVLLHGGPGTGKTLTAESVAEIAEKPLYRVTCGDVGTDAVEVERYLESVFHLGRRWSCVVLLDEADVFLEQRSLANLERNALVSVFLRVIEYYDGILILTSNRVGTFDEAFKSRIQLALHYHPLDNGQRRKIWANFLSRLEALEEDMDVTDMRQHTNDLAKYEMNGRQIRNAITTARQLARYRKKPMNFAHLNHVIGVSQRFEKYIRDVKDGADDETIAREEMVR